MPLFEKLTSQDKEAIDSWINRYAFNNLNLKYSIENRAPLSHLLRIWDREKSDHLYKLLGEQFIIKKEVSMEISIGKLRDDFRQAMEENPVMYQFREDFFNIVETKCPSVSRNAHAALEGLFFPGALADNKTSNMRSYDFINPDTEEEVKLEREMKVMRVLGRFAKVFNIPNFEQFRQAHSLILNQKEIKGTLCLSIHPLDYMTMSDNENNWESCMNWRYGGEYCQGTIEMMNSPNVVIAYVESKSNKLELPNYSIWNSKKWRQLFFIDKDAMVNIKGYPYQSDQLTGYVLDWLKELAETNLGITYPVHIDFKSGKAPLNDDEICFLCFDTGLMYNDFGCLPGDYAHHLYITKDFFDYSKDLDKYIYKRYSGLSECMFCGETEWAEMDGTDLFFNTDMRACSHCTNETRCCCCNRRLGEDEVNEFEGDIYCTECFFEHYGQDAFDEDGYYPYDQLMDIAVSRYTEGFDGDETFNFLAHDLKQVPNLKDYIINGEESLHHLDGRRYYINWPELTPLAWSEIVRVFDFDTSYFIKEGFLKDRPYNDAIKPIRLSF